MKTISRPYKGIGIRGVIAAGMQGTPPEASPNRGEMPSGWPSVSPLEVGCSRSLPGRATGLGPRAGARVRRLGDEPDLGHVTSRGPRQAQLDGFDLHSNAHFGDRDQQDHPIVITPIGHHDRSEATLGGWGLAVELESPSGPGRP